MKCLNCGKSVKQTPGKRAKNYCDPNCRQKYWLKNNKKKAERGPGRPPKKDICVQLPSGGLAIVSEDASPELLQSLDQMVKIAKKANVDAPNTFMGHTIPKGLKGIDLAIWKSEIREKK